MKPVKGVEGRGREEAKGIIAGGQSQRGEKVVKSHKGQNELTGLNCTSEEREAHL